MREWQGNATATTNVIGAHDVPDEVHVAARLWTTADGWEGTLRGNYPAHWLVASKDAPLRLTIDDGTVGSAYVTGHSEHDSEITSAIVGVGPAPFD